MEINLAKYPEYYMINNIQSPSNDLVSYSMIIGQITDI
jgi:hypothetical protein